MLYSSGTQGTALLIPSIPLSIDHSVMNHPDHHRAQTIDGSRVHPSVVEFIHRGIGHAPTRERKIITISKQAASTKKAQRKAPKLQCEQDFGSR
jgi:hypothetical protein